MKEQIAELYAEMDRVENDICEAMMRCDSALVKELETEYKLLEADLKLCQYAQ